MKTMKDNNGVEVPAKYVSEFDKRRDRVVRRLHARANRIRCSLEDLAVETASDLTQLLDLKDKIGEKGNFAVSSFDGLLRVSFKQRYDIRLDERVAKARELMVAYVDSVFSRSSAAPEDVQTLRTLVDEAFRASSNGMLSVGRILALTRMNISNADWREAREILLAAIRPQKGKRYILFEFRNDTQHEFRQLRLDLADCLGGVQND